MPKSASGIATESHQYLLRASVDITIDITAVRITATSTDYLVSDFGHPNTKRQLAV